MEETNPHDLRTQIALLAMRVDNLGREKEAIEEELKAERKSRAESEKETEKRLAAIEKAFNRGAGIMIVLPFIGTAIGLLLAYGKIIFAPWTRSP